MDEAALFVLTGQAMTNDRELPGTVRSLLIADAAGVLGVSRRTVYYHIQAGRLRTIRTRGGSQRVLWSSIEALLGESRENVASRPEDRGLRH